MRNVFQISITVYFRTFWFESWFSFLMFHGLEFFWVSELLSIYTWFLVLLGTLILFNHLQHVAIAF